VYFLLHFLRATAGVAGTVESAY